MGNQHAVAARIEVHRAPNHHIDEAEQALARPRGLAESHEVRQAKHKVAARAEHYPLHIDVLGIRIVGFKIFAVLPRIDGH